MEYLELFSYPFMQRAFIAGSVLALLMAGLGVFVTLRRMAFFGDGIAHASLAGIAIAILAGTSPLPIALLWGVFIAVLIYWLERNTRLPSDTLIGIFFTASMALGVTLMSFAPGYQPELVSFLFGSILSISSSDTLLIIVMSVVILLWLTRSFRELVYMSLTEESAEVSGVPVHFNKLILYVALAMATVLGVKILGIILVSALLVLPAATGRLLATNFKSYIVLSVLFAELFVFLGLILSFLYDLPSGATIILVGTFFFILSAIIGKRT